MKKSIRRTMKQIIAVALITTLTVGTCATVYADNSTTTYISRQEQVRAGVEYVIQCGKFDKQCGSSTIGGKVIETEEIATLHDGIISMLDDSTVVNNVNYLDDSVIANDVNIYAADMYNVNAGSVNLSDVIVAENNISFGASTVNSDSAILYSKNGNISFYCGDVTFTGIIYAPNGTVRFEGSNININGVIIAKDVIVRAGTFNVNYNSSVAESVDNLDYIEDNELFGLCVYNNEEEQKKSLQWKTSSSIETIDIYARYGSDGFKKISTTKDEMYAIDYEAIVDVADYYVVANTKFGEEILSNIVTLVKGEEGIYEDSIDSDKDGIPDGYEYLIGTDALNPDTDGDGFSDGYEVNVLCTDPLTYDEDKDFDNDGLTNLQEMELGTNPYLKDSDFDGIIDSMDETPMKANVNIGIEVDYNIPINIGIFDSVSKYLDEDGNKCQIVYNYVNDQTKYMTDSKNRSYNLYNNKNQVVAAIGYVDDRIIANIYSYNGDKIESITHNGFQYEFAYDEDGNMINAMIGGRTLISDKYSEKNLVLEEYGNNNLNQYAYDENGNVITQEVNGNIAYKWTYDDKGNITSYNDLYIDEIFTYTYDETGNVKTINSNKGFKITYYEDDNTYSVTYEDDNTSRTQDVTISEKENETGDIYEVTTTNLISNGKLVSVVTGDTTSERTIYEDNRVIIHSKYTSSEDGVTKIEYQDGKILEYEYDKCGNIVAVNECGERKISYEYDDLGQLIRENNLYANKTVVYVYDNAGNILESKEYLYSIDILGECISEKKYKYQDNEWKDLLTNYNGENITYDQIGNPLSYRDGMEFTWVGRKLATIHTEQDVISYKYNSNGIRISKTVNDIETTYQLDGTKIISETTNGNIIWYIYDENNYVIGFEYVGKTYYFEKNAQGDVTRIFDAEGNFISEYFYDAWGNVIAVVGNEEIANINPFRYRSYYCDNETGLYYVSSRYYDPEISRFINADVMLDTANVLGFNLFTYCGNNPIMYVDPTGYGRTYVIYYNNPGGGFYDQAINSPYYNRKSKNVYMKSVTSNQDFIDAWNSMSGKIDYVYLYLHGGKGVLYFKGESLSFSGKQSFGSLNSKKVKKGVYLLSCKGGAGNEGNNVAWMFAKLTSSKVYACTGSVSYSKIFGKYYARKAWDWGIIKTFYYQKKYIFWGANIAKSAAGQW